LATFRYTILANYYLACYLGVIHLNESCTVMTEELIEALDSSNKGDIPSPFGEEQYVLLGSPASVQSRIAKEDTHF
jgi:hypothetical protein